MASRGSNAVPALVPEESLGCSVGISGGMQRGASPTAESAVSYADDTFEDLSEAEGSPPASPSRANSSQRPGRGRGPPRVRLEEAEARQGGGGDDPEVGFEDLVRRSTSTMRTSCCTSPAALSATPSEVRGRRPSE